MSAPKATILFVDDEQANLFLYKVMFRNDVDVLTAESVEEALTLLDEQDQIAAVISDMRMPYISGLEFITKAREKRNNIPYYLLTGFALNDEIRSAIDNKVIANYFQKPLDREQILSVIPN
jgi:two-component system response regulator (stage 0 sporulation protein F)